MTTQKQGVTADELEPIKLGVTGNEMYVFYFRRPFASENSEAYERLTAYADLSGMEKGKKDFEVIKENLISFSSRPPELHRVQGEEFKPVKLKAESVAEAFNELFAEYTPRAEQIIIEAWLEFQKKRQLTRYF